jgi:glyoxylase-like metal-dependent hydrolase (beta-lactamase superfamily II)
MSTIHRIEIPIPFPLKRVNCYYVEDSTPTLIDAGVNLEESRRIIQSAIEKTGGSLSRVRRIILTHCHSDHLGLAASISKMSGAEIIVHGWDRHMVPRPGETKFTERREEFREYFMEAGVPEDLVPKCVEIMVQRLKNFFKPFTGETILEGGERLRFDDFDLEVVHTPGHTPGSICLLNRDDGTFFSGDSLLEKTTSNPTAQVRNPEQKSDYRSMFSFEASLDLIGALPVRLVLPGHGRPFSNHRRRVEQLKAHHRERNSEVLGILRTYANGPFGRGGATRFMVAKDLFPEVKGIELFLALSEAQGHLEVLEARGIAASFKQGSARVYCLSKK